MFRVSSSFCWHHCTGCPSAYISSLLVLLPRGLLFLFFPFRESKQGQASGCRQSLLKPHPSCVLLEHPQGTSCHLGRWSTIQSFPRMALTGLSASSAWAQWWGWRVSSNTQPAIQPHPRVWVPVPWFGQVIPPPGSQNQCSFLNCLCSSPPSLPACCGVAAFRANPGSLHWPLPVCQRR